MILNIGPHKIKVGSLTNGLKELMGEDKADIFYSDPPWGPGLLKYFETLRMKQTNDLCRKDIDFGEFIEAFFGVIDSYAKNVVFIEYAINGESLIREMAIKHNLTHHKTLNIKYDAGGKHRMLPSHLHMFSKDGSVDSSYLDALEGREDNYDFVTTVMKKFSIQNGIVLDPCCGLGLMADAALGVGMRFRGNELNPKRAMHTEKIIARKLK